ncbi:MAG TPA: tRNA lysidine(34) synthetase TilS [Fimbriimonadaceae bacterium]|nr:tRNA lysidine(34) synthetase TilS [Fimbriimonadaceae bacterium]HRJ32229.1 tRNA lysidine(34) synthetase TilS [Fimbriimonadaceae bacterium]
MLDRFVEHLETSGLWPTGETVVVGYSGGADSTCLVHLAHRAGLRLIAAHLHHGMRPEADREQKLAEAWCAELDIPFATGRADVPGLARDFRIGLEEAGRRARQEFLQQAMFRLGGHRIATAHTLDDQVETVVFRMARGTGLQGLGGIAPVRDVWIRPLLPFSRTETRQYCADQGLWFHDDPSNSDVQFARARIRLRVVPELEAIHPDAKAAIQRLARLAREEDACLDGMAAAALEQAELPLNGDFRFLTRDCEVALRRASWVAMPLVLRRRAVRLVTEVLGAQVDFEWVQSLSEALASDGAGSRTAEGGDVLWEWTEDRVHVRQQRPTENFRYPLTLPGETFADEFGWVLTALPCEPTSFERPPRSWDVVVDRAAIQGSLYFRSAQEGDRMQPLGLDGTKLLSDMLREAGLTAAARRRIPVVCDLVGPIWVPGVGVSDRVRVQSGTSNGLNLRFGPIPE